MPDVADALAKLADQAAAKWNIVYIPKWKQFLVYRKGIYVEIDEEQIRARVRMLLARQGLKLSPRNVNDVMSAMRDNRNHTPDEFDADERYTNFKNGLYDWSKRALLKHTPEYLSIRQVQTDYIEDAKCPYIEQLFREWVGESAERLAEVVAWVLMSKYDVEGFIYLLGRGSNGKGTYTSILTELIGPDNVSSVSMKAVNTDKFAASGMYGKLVNISNETSGTIEDSSRVLEITGGDPVQWERKFGHPWTDRNRAKQIYAGMSVPAIKNGIVSDGIGRRFLPIFFPNRFDGSTPKSEILARARKEYPGLVAWAMRLLPGLKRRNHFSGDLSIDEKVKLYRLLSDGVYLFAQHFTREEGTYITKESLFQAYLEMCAAYRLIPVGEYVFYRWFQREIAVREGRIPPSLRSEKTPAFLGIHYSGYEGLDRLSTLSTKLLRRNDVWNGERIIEELRKVCQDVRSYVRSLVLAGKMTPEISATLFEPIAKDFNVPWESVRDTYLEVTAAVLEEMRTPGGVR